MAFALNGEGALWDAVSDGDLARVKTLLQKGADPNMTCPDAFVRKEMAPKTTGTGRSLLHHAAWAGNLEVFRTIVEAGGDVERRRNTAWRPNGGVRGRGNTPLHAAVMYRRTPIVQYLLDLGVDVNTPGEQGYTALHISTKFNYPELVELLLRAGARTDMITRDEKTARDLAVWGRDRSHEQMGNILAIFDKFDAQCKARAAAAGQSNLPGAPLRPLGSTVQSTGSEDAVREILPSRQAQKSTKHAAAAEGDSLDLWLRTRSPIDLRVSAAPQSPPKPMQPTDLVHRRPPQRWPPQGCELEGSGYVAQRQHGCVPTADRASSGSSESGLRNDHSKTCTDNMLGGRWQKAVNTRPW